MSPEQSNKPSEIVRYELLDNAIAQITLANGKVNPFSTSQSKALLSVLDQAETQAKAILICGNPGIFSAGFDLRVISQGVDAAKEMFLAGFTLLERLYSYPLPVVIACEGHAVGLGVFMLLTADYRIGATGEFTLRLPETEISLGFSPILRVIGRKHIDPKHHTQAMIQSRAYDPVTASQIGMLDEVVSPELVKQKALEKAIALSSLPAEQYAINKRFIRAQEIEEIRQNPGF